MIMGLPNLTISLSLLVSFHLQDDISGQDQRREREEGGMSKASDTFSGDRHAKSTKVVTRVSRRNDSRLERHRDHTRRNWSSTTNSPTTRSQPSVFCDIFLTPRRELDVLPEATALLLRFSPLPRTGQKRMKPI